MKNIKFLFIVVAIFFLNIYVITAAEKPKVEIGAVKQTDKGIEFTIISSKPFIVGGNVFVLHIGEKLFSYSKQTKENGKGTITFLITTNDFRNCIEQQKMFLTYGEKAQDSTQLDEFSKQEYNPCWYLGIFTKQLLIK